MFPAISPTSSNYEDCCFFRDMEGIWKRGPFSTGFRLKEAMRRRSFHNLQEAQETLDWKEG